MRAAGNPYRFKLPGPGRPPEHCDDPEHIGMNSAGPRLRSARLTDRKWGPLAGIGAQDQKRHAWPGKASQVVWSSGWPLKVTPQATPMQRPVDWFLSR